MAKRNRVLYAFTDHATYEKLAKKDEYTVYFVYDTVKDDDGNETPGEYGTIYKGQTRVGSALAKDIVFNEDITVHCPQNAIDDESVIHIITKGTSLEQFAKDAIYCAKNFTEDLRNEILGNLVEDEEGNITGDDPGEIRKYIANAVSSECKDEKYYWSEGNPENLATTIWVSNNYVTNDKLGKIEELATVLTNETIDKLIAAAQGIEKALEPYYTKVEADAKFNKVLVFDSSVPTANSSGFPEIGDASALYIDDSENIMYRWALLGDDTTDRDYVEISGAGGSGSNATIETKVYFKDGKATTTIAKNTSCEVTFLFSSAYTYLKYDKRTGTFKKEEQQTGTTGTAKYYLDGTLIGSGNVTQSNYNSEDDSKNVYNTFTVPASRFTGSSHNLKIVCSDADGNSAENTVAISIVSVSIVSSYTPTPSPLTSNISIPVTASSSNEINLYYKVDSDDAVLYKIIPASTQAYEPILIPPTAADGTTRTHGYHTIQVWATTYISETETTISTEILSYNVIWYDANDTTPIISTTLKSEADSEGNYNVTQYEYITLNYQVYPKGTVSLIVADESGTEKIVNTLDVNTTVKTWSYTFDTEGKYQMYIKVNSDTAEAVSTKYPIVVAKSEYAMDPTPGAVMFFTAKNRSNDESADTRSVWKSEIGDYTAKFTGFAWNTVSGWRKEDNSDTCSLRVGGGARVEIPFMPFENDYRENGQTIEFEYMTSALSNSQTTVVSCYSDTDESGIVITATGAKFYSKDFAGNNAISVPFKENEKIRISFVITPLNQDDKGRGVDDPAANITLYDSQSGKNSVHNSISEGYWRFVKVYINGILSSVNLYTSDFKQSKPATIIIGSDDATVDIYSIRAYNKVLYSKAIVDNMIGDTQDASEKIELFKRNNILTADGTDIDYTALMKQVPCLFVTCESTSNVDEYKNDEHILPRSKGDKRGVTAVYNADNLSDEAKKFYDFPTSFIAYNAQMTVQGTSSQYYPRKNWKLNFKTNKKYNEDWQAQVQTSKPTYLYTDDINAVLGQKDNYQKDYVLKDYDKLNPGTAYTSIERISSLPAKKFCLKADFAESSGTHNTGMARYADYILKGLGKDYLTPPQYAQYVAAGGGTAGMSTVRTRTTVDGYPIAMFWRQTSKDEKGNDAPYSFYGKFNFNIDKGAENTFGFTDVDESLVNSNTGKSFDLFNEDWYDAASIDRRFAYESPVECYEFLNNADDISKFKYVTDDVFTNTHPETGKLTWLDAFEVRHPDSDLQNEDFANGKDPVHWRKFCKWVSSTDRAGYHDPATKLLPIAYEWTRSSEDLITGAEDTKTYIAYDGTKDEFISAAAAESTVIDKTKLYVLYPEDSKDANYGHIMAWSETAGSWEDTGEFVDEQDSDTAKIYYISDTTDENYGKLYKYNKVATSSTPVGWNIISGISISEYELDTPVKYGNVTYKYDTAEYRFAKFKNELPLHMNVNMTTAYYLLTEFFCMADQRAKNMMFASWGYEPGAGKIKEASTFTDEETAAAAGYKPVYEYGDFTDTVAAASFVNHQDSAVLGAAATNVCINEIYANSNLIDETGTIIDKSIELYNPTDASVDISGWTLKKGDSLMNVESDKSLTFTNVVIPAGGYFIVKCIKKSTIENVLSSGISASNGFALRLYDNTGTLVDEVDNGTVNDSNISKSYVNFDYTTSGYESYSRTVNGADTWSPSATYTIGTENIITEPKIIPVDTSTKLYSYQVVGTEITGFSGLCWNANKSGFYAVSDKGKIYSLAFDGTVELMFDNYDAATGESKGLVVDSTGSATNDYDFEAITIDADGNLYVSTELYTVTDDDNVSVTYPSKIIKIEKDFTKGTVIAELDDTGKTANQGLEGLTYYKDNMFFVGNQSNPISAFLYSFNKKTDGSDDIVGIVDNSSLPVIPITNGKDPEDSEYKILGYQIDIEGMRYGITEIADLYFDASTSKLWILDSKTGGLAALNAEVLESGVTYTLDTLYSVPAKTGSVSNENPEALLIDSSNGFAYIGCDNEAGKYLYKISLTNEYFGDNTVVINELDPENKRWELYNCTDTDINLNGYSMTKDGDDSTRFTFGDITIAAKGFVVIERDETGKAGPTFGLSDDKGFYYRLFNADGALINEVDNSTNIVVIPNGMTYGAVTDGSDKFVLFRNYGTIGSSNAEGILNAGIYINEVDTTGNEIGKRFEIYNASGADYDLSGHTFVKDDKSWTVVDTAIGDGLGLPTATVPNTGYLIVQCNNTGTEEAIETSPAEDATKWPDFGLSGSKGFVLAIKNADGSFVDIVKNKKGDSNFIAISDGETWGRATDGADQNYVKFTTQTLGISNADGGGVRYEPTATSNGIVINEVSPATDKIELYNSTDADIDLSGYIISKNGDALSAWTIPSGTTITAHGFHVITCKQYGTFGPKFGISGTDGFLLTVADSAGVIVDVLDDRKDSENFVLINGTYSYGRKTDGGSEWTVFSKDSIGETNANGTEYVPVEVDPGKEITDHVVINEICGDSKLIELYNPTSSAVTLGGEYGLFKEDTDDYSASDWWAYPAGAVIPAKGYYTIKAKSDGTAAGPAFGISLKPGKSFYLRLLKYSSTLDTTNKGTLLSTTTVVDEIDNLTSPVNAAENSNMTFGRVHDGTTNWTLFEAPGTINEETGASDASAGLSNNNGIPYATPDVDPTENYRRVKYWVPSDCEYVYYPLFYDNDTILGLDNEGHIKFNPNTESTDVVGTGYAFNGTESVLWLNFKDAFSSNIESVYKTMRTTLLTEANCLRYFTTEHSDHWAEALYNIDAKFKYIDPETMGYLDYQYTDPSTGTLGVNRRDSTYLYEAQGSRAEHRSWWINNRFVYMDSRYNAGDYFNNYVTLRIYTPNEYSQTVPPESAFRLIPYSDMYLRIKFGSTSSTVRAEKNKEYTVSSPMTTSYNDTETIIYGASNILSFGDMSAKYARTAQFDNATKATEINFGAESPYYNKNLTEFSVGANNTVLKKIDVRGSSNLSTISSLNAITSLEDFLATNTSMSTVEFSTNGAKLKNIEYPDTLTVIKLINMPDITNDGIKILNYANIVQLWIESCPNIDTWTMFLKLISTKNSRLNTITLTDINWTINSTGTYEYWNKLLSMDGMNESSIRINTPYLTGVVTIGENVAVSTGYKESIEKMFKSIGCNLTVNTKTTVDVRGITIVGEEDIAVNEEYTYKISYNPDDYIKADQHGVTWEIPEDFDVISTDDESVTVKYTKSTAGNLSYELKATSKYNNALTTAFTVKPIATLSAITLTDSDGNILDENSVITIDEESSFTVTVGFIPAKTKDTGVEIRLTSTAADVFEKRESGNLYEYDETTRQLTFYTKPVNTDITTSFSVISAIVPTVRSISPNVKVKNIISRVVSFIDANGNPLQGSLLVGYTDAFTGETTQDSVQTNASGEISFKTNTKYGTGELVLRQIKPNAAPTKHYNDVGTYIFSEVNIDTAVEDIKQTFVFYEPVEYTINIWHDVTAVTDVSMKVYSQQNDSEYGLTDGLYNNVISSIVTNSGVNYCQAKIMLLANTAHTITVSEVSKDGTPVTKGNIYETLRTTITTGTVNSTVDLYLSRDYLGDIESYSGTELHMTVKTGADYTSLRLFVNTSSEITINWGDGSSTTIDGAAATTGAEDHSFNTELQITHAYTSANTEYDIIVKNTAPITWFHVMPSTAVNMTPCFFKGSDTSTLPKAWAENIGGLVAYQSVGVAKFSKVPSFRVANDTDKQYVEFACVGYLYNNIEDMESADELFMNTKLEQIPAKPIFTKNVNITSFNKTFKNTNITSIPNEFFKTNTKAVSFEETFSGCKNLVTLNLTENSSLIYLDDSLEIQSLYRMFYNCIKLTDNVPALWKIFYGCSKARNSKSYEGCSSAGNYKTIPYDWGGIGDTYYESTPKILDYLQFIGGEGYFEFPNIILTNNMRYELDITKENIYYYEGMPIISGGYATDPNNPETTLKYAIDFIEGGNNKGCRATGYHATLRCRIGATQDSDFLSTTTAQDDVSTVYPSNIGDNITGMFPAISGGVTKVNGEEYSVSDTRHRMILDICKTYSGIATMTDLTDPRLNSPKTYIQNWTNEINGVTDGELYNLPMRLFGSYDSYHNTPGNDPSIANENTGYDPQYSHTEYHIPMMPRRNFSRELFHELKIYSSRTASGIGTEYDNQESDLIHDIVPAFGMINNILVPFMYDKITGDICAYSSQHGDTKVLTNNDRGVTNFEQGTCAIFYPKK